MKSRLVTYLPVLFGLAIFAGSCSLSGNDPIIVPFVEEEFYAEMWEQFTPQGRQVELKLRTIEEVECTNATIEYEYLQQGDDERVLSINSIEIPENCQEGNAPARGTVVLGPLENGVYPITVGLRDVVSASGLITITTDRLQLFIENSAGVIPLRLVTRRIPVNTVWGYFDTQGDAGRDSLAGAFISDLTSISQSQIIQHGHYGYFSVDEENMLKWEDGTEEKNAYRHAFQVRLPNEAGVAEIKSLLSAYREDYGDTIAITAFTTTGESW